VGAGLGVGEKIMDKVRYIYEGRDRRRFEFRLINEAEMNARQVQIFYLFQVELIRDAIAKRDVGLWRALLDYTRDSIPEYINTLEMPEGFYGSDEEWQMTALLDQVMSGKNPLRTPKKKIALREHLYFLVAGDILKVGASSDVKRRMSRIRAEFQLPFQLYRLLNNGGHRERRILSDLGPYWLEGQGRNGDSRECFRWCRETKEYVDALTDVVLIDA